MALLHQIHCETRQKNIEKIGMGKLKIFKTEHNGKAVNVPKKSIHYYYNKEESCASK